MKVRLILMLIAYLGFNSTLYASPVEDLSAILTGRVGSSSEDRRHDVTKNVLGVIIKVGCEGDVLDAGVSITGVSGKLEGDTAVMTANYSGKYTRQGWGAGCLKVSPALHGLEEKTITGSYQFKVIGKAFQRPTVTWGNGSNFGEVPDFGHDSNQMAIRAVQNAIGSAF